MHGLDAEDDLVDPMEHLDIYKNFLGDEEFEKVKSSYLKTVETMTLVYKTELERLKLSDGLNEEL